MKRVFALSENKFDIKGFEKSSDLNSVETKDFNVLFIDDKSENRQLIIKYQNNINCVVLNEYKGIINDVFFVPVIVSNKTDNAPQYFYCKEDEDVIKVLLDIEKFNCVIPNMRRISSEEISCKMVDLTSKKKKENSNKLKILVG